MVCGSTQRKATELRSMDSRWPLPPRLVNPTGRLTNNTLGEISI
jgi:hypothetical protein